ncbi:MAG TPA: YncE family protein [Solirubrobacteraceae bacterium]|jgi:DNA-binding beta-propeller fold protein YncE
MRSRAAAAALALGVLVAGCGGSSHHRQDASAITTTATIEATEVPVPARAAPATARPPVQALVTDETQNRLLIVDLPSGRVVRRIALPRDPEDIAANGGECSTAVVVSAAAGEVTVLDRETLGRRGVIGGFVAPHIPEIAPGGQYAYVTDDARGTVTVISLADARVTSTIEVGAGAHHLSFDPIRPLAWVALGESARTIVILDTSDAAHPRVTGRFDPGFEAHDLSFSPDGRRVWVTAASQARASVFRAADHRLMFRVAIGPGPQHVAFAGRFAYVTSGYGRTISKVDAVTGRILRVAPAPYGSFEFDAGQGYVVAASLLRGTLAIYNAQLGLLRVVHLAPATREVAISTA